MSSNEFSRARHPVGARIAFVGVLGLAGGAVSALAATDLAAVQAVPQRGQSADETRRDRYECHNWAVEQTGVVPHRTELGAGEVDRERRVDRAITGAGVGAVVGGLVRASQHENPSNGVLAGGAIGAVVGALLGRKGANAPDPEFDGYLRALSACLEGRGYVVVVADAEAAAAGAAEN